MKVEDNIGISLSARWVRLLAIAGLNLIHGIPNKYNCAQRKKCTSSALISPKL